jgi:hypothetical protein
MANFTDEGLAMARNWADWMIDGKLATPADTAVAGATFGILLDELKERRAEKSNETIQRLRTALASELALSTALASELARTHQYATELAQLRARLQRCEVLSAAVRENRQITDDLAAFARNGGSSLNLLVAYERTRNEMWAALDALDAKEPA